MIETKNVLDEIWNLSRSLFDEQFRYAENISSKSVKKLHLIERQNGKYEVLINKSGSCVCHCFAGEIKRQCMIVSLGNGKVELSFDGCKCSNLRVLAYDWQDKLSFTEGLNPWAELRSV